MEINCITSAIFRVPTHVNVEFTSLGLCPNPEVLQSPANDTHTVAFEVGQGNHYVSRCNGLRNKRLFEDVALGDVYTVVTGSNVPICTNKGTVECGGIEAIT